MKALAEKLKETAGRLSVPASGHANVSIGHEASWARHAVSRAAWSSTMGMAVVLLVLGVSLAAALPAAGQITISDDFNDNSLDSTLWEVLPFAQPYTVAETNQQLEMGSGTSTLTSSAVAVFLKIPFQPGNLDVQVDYHLLNWVDLPGGDIVAALGVSRMIPVWEPPAEPTGDYSMVREDTHYIAMMGTEDTTVSTTDMTGRLRFTWFGPTVTLYYWDSSSGTWHLLRQGDFPGRLNQPVGLALVTGASANQYAKVAFDNFTVTGQPAVGAMMNGLIEDVSTLNAQIGISKRLDAIIGAVQSALEDQKAKNNVAAIGAMHAFIYAVWAQKGKQLTEADADRLIGEARTIIVALGGY